MRGNSWRDGEGYGGEWGEEGEDGETDQDEFGGSRELHCECLCFVPSCMDEVWKRSKASCSSVREPQRRL